MLHAATCYLCYRQANMTDLYLFSACTLPATFVFQLGGSTWSLVSQQRELAIDPSNKGKQHRGATVYHHFSSRYTIASIVVFVLQTNDVTLLRWQSEWALKQMYGTG